ncbi:MAG: hypothetical protein HY360_15490 [Verrucomicrobia bacterium]|nr:hypothetical protein [Verrucomicrobiota bacterium]
MKWRTTYWRDGPAEVDFVVSGGQRTWGLEVKSGRSAKLSGLTAFRRRYPRAEYLLVGGQGIPLEEFLSSAPQTFLI